jgi:WD40 repeat protein
MSIQPQSAATPDPEQSGQGQPDNGQKVYVQSANAAESAVVIQVAGDLHISDPGQLDRWLSRSRATTPGECPYPGLDAFEPSEAQWFFGRDDAISDVLGYLDRMRLGGPGGPLLLVAPSGTGKSSLLRAGLWKALDEGRLAASGSAAWPRVAITALGPHPARALREALATVTDTRGIPWDARTIVVIDQMEELFSVAESEAERQEFLDLVGTLTAHSGPGSALVVLGMRADFYGPASQYPVLRKAMQSRQVVLGALSADEVRSVIAGPALAAGLTLEPGLPEILLHDLGVNEPGVNEGTEAAGTDGAGSYEPGRLPLLAHALRAIWQNRDGNRLTIAGYRRAGGIAGAIAKSANDVYGALDESRQAIAREMFLALVRVGRVTGEGETGVDTRRRVAPGTLLERAPDPAAARAVLEAFTAARLLTSGQQAVEITHEALLREWPLLREWVNEARAGLLVQQELEAAAASWADQGKDAGTLYRGVQLSAAQQWAAVPGHSRQLSPGGRDFLAASERLRRRGIQRRNGVIAVLAALSLVLAGLSVFALNEQSTVRSQRDAAQTLSAHAEAGLLAAESSQAWSDFRPDTALELATEAYRQYPQSPQVRDALLATQALPITGRLLTPGQSGSEHIVGVAFNPAGTIIAGTTSDGYVQLWSASTYKLLWRFKFPDISPNSVTQVNSVEFSPSGQLMAVTWPGGPWLFNVANPARPVHVSTLHVPSAKGSPLAQVTSLTFSPDGQTVAGSIGESESPPLGLVLMWNASTGAVTHLLPDVSLTESLAFSPNGQSLVTGTATGEVDLWNIATGTKLAEPQAATTTTVDGESAVAISPNGQLIAFAVSAGTDIWDVKLWSVATGKVVATIAGSNADVTSLAFSPNGSQLAASDQNGAIRLWDVTVSPPVLIGGFSGHRQLIEHIAFSPDGDTLASASDDGTVALWSTRGSLLGGLANTSIAMAFSPDGRTLALSTRASSGPVIALYAMPARTLIRELPVPEIAALAFSPDGRTLAVAPRTPTFGPVELWNVATGKMTGTFATGFPDSSATTGNPSEINSIAFSPDGTMLAVSATQSTTIGVWSTATLRQVASFSDIAGSPLPTSFGSGSYDIAFSPNGKLLVAVGVDDEMRVYSVPSFALVDKFEGLDSMNAVAFSPNGKLLAFGNSVGDVFLFAIPAQIGKLNGNTQLGIYAASTKTIWSLQFQDNNTLIAGGQDGVVRFWTVPPTSQWDVPPYNGSFFDLTNPAQEIATHSGPVSALSYSPALGLVATGSASGSRVWQTSPAQVATSVCQALKAPVGQQLWADYLVGVPYNPVCP